MGTEATTEDDVQKKGRRRKKLLYGSIRQQLEFYFSDSNLSKDRFLSTLTKEDPYVDISVFLQFNKIRKLTSSIEDISKAITKSELLEVSEDKTKVKRKLPLITKDNVDECTLYVEQLKSDVTHDWLSTIFSEFGTVTYVSIPKYKHSGMVKGFAFVEFEQEESVQAALQYFEEIGCKIPSCMEPENLCSITTYKIEANAVINENTATKKRFSVSEEKEIPDAKRVKIEKVEESVVQVDVAQKSKDEVLVEIDQDISTSDDKQQKRKLKKSHKQKSILKELGLKILSKKDWKKMRNRYLDMQRKTMKELKMHLNRQRFAAKYDTYKSQAVNDTNNQVSGETVASATDIEFIPKVIVKVALPEPCYTAKLVKRKLKTYSPDIKYVDIPLGSKEAYLRFGNSKSAEEFCSSDFKDPTSLLEGDEEKDYWNKIKESATEKKEKLTKNNKKRGRDKLLKRAEKQAANHIRFNEEPAEQI